MRRLLIKRFVKNPENVKEPQVREAYGKLAGFVGVFSNLLLCAMKIIVGAVSGSIAVVADGVNNLADASSSVIALLGFKLAAMPEDKEHPYGHARIEYISGLIVSIVIILVGVELAKTSFFKILTPEVVDTGWAVIITLVAAIAVKLWQAAFNISIGKTIDSVALIATGTDSRNDVISTSVVLLSLVVSHFTDVAVDGWAGMAVALFIVYSGIMLTLETVSPLLGEAPTEELVSDIGKLVTSYEGVLGIHDLCVHNYGPGKVFASIHIEVDANEDIMESHDLIDNIERDVSAKLHLQLVGHMDPVETQNSELDRIKKFVSEALCGLEGVENIHDFRMVSGVSRTNVIFDVVLLPNCKISHEEILAVVEDVLHKEDEKYCAIVTFDKSYV